ncbi:DNA primase [Rhodococcus ruber]|uniref:DNA primase n=1 Tax=Rhodococcus ruber TaxID=1830 RepID=UPI001EEF5AF3|nr:DNA primase [Rhodococcus ruber]MCF8786076.1 DNA primase [Rhodococcus ruber]
MESPTQPTHRFPGEFLDELRTRVRLEQLAEGYLDLKPAGAGRIKALCPLHSERTPSFTINIAWGRFHCFGCGADGDAIDFLMQVDGISFVEAVTDLAHRAGLSLPDSASTTDDYPKRQQIRATLDAAQSILYQWLFTHPAARPARDFLRSRNFTADHAAHWGIGYNPPNGNALINALIEAGHPLERQLAAGTAKQSEHRTYDAFRGRLVWPVHDPQGRLVGFTGRDLSGRAHAKYLNTGTTDLFHKGELLYGFDKARQAMLSTRQVFVVEGQTDVMAMSAAGMTNTVAASGTAFTTAQADLLASRIGDGGQIVVAFDNDEAGRKATWALFHACQRFTTHITAIDLAGYGAKADPCDVRTTSGDAALLEASETRRPVLQLLLDADIAGCDLSTPEGKVEATRRVENRLAAVHSSVLRREYQRWAADRIGVDDGDIRFPATISMPRTHDSAEPAHQLADAEATVAAFLISHPTQAARLLQQHGTDAYGLLPGAVAELVDMSTTMFPDGRPKEGEDADLWSTVMTDVVEPEHYPALWQIAFTEAPTIADIEDTIPRLLRRRLLQRQVALQQQISEGVGDSLELLRQLAKVNERLRGCA